MDWDKWLTWKLNPTSFSINALMLYGWSMYLIHRYNAETSKLLHDIFKKRGELVGKEFFEERFRNLHEDIRRVNQRLADLERDVRRVKKRANSSMTEEAEPEHELESEEQ